MDFIDLKTQYSRLKSSIDARIHGVLEHGQYVMGPEVLELERQLAEYVGSKHCIGVASGTDALLMALMGLDIGPGDEVITVPFTCVMGMYSGNLFVVDPPTATAPTAPSRSREPTSSASRSTSSRTTRASRARGSRTVRSNSSATSSCRRRSRRAPRRS